MIEHDLEKKTPCGQRRLGTGSFVFGLVWFGFFPKSPDFLFCVCVCARAYVG